VVDVDAMALFLALAEYAERRGVPPLNTFAGCWSEQIDPTWWVAVNAHREEQMVSLPPECGKDEVPVPPFTALVYYNGWPAGLFTPHSGAFAAGEGANPATFTAALDRRASEGAPRG
jgi:hypothetical protein